MTLFGPGDADPRVDVVKTCVPLAAARVTGNTLLPCTGTVHQYRQLPVLRVELAVRGRSNSTSPSKVAPLKIAEIGRGGSKLSPKPEPAKGLGQPPVCPAHRDLYEDSLAYCGCEWQGDGRWRRRRHSCDSCDQTGESVGALEKLCGDRPRT